MATPDERRLKFILRSIDAMVIDNDYFELYENVEDSRLRGAFAALHRALDVEFEWMNRKAQNGQEGHFNAENSRNLLSAIEKIDDLMQALERLGRKVSISEEYERVIDSARSWLAPTNGSLIPAGLTPVQTDRFDAVFHLADSALRLPTHEVRVQLQMVGEGAYAVVHRFEDPTYGMTIARKRLKDDADERDRERFRREFDLMKRLSFPYILEVYRFNESDSSYTMEFCESTLEKYVSHRNNKESFSFGVRRRIALQFLYGLNYLHVKGVFHRDLSLNNVLLRVYPEGAVVVKLSDFGLAKPVDSSYTRTGTEVRGTIIDPALDNFKDFGAVNDIYAVGFILSFIFRGVKRILPGDTPVGAIVQKCAHADPSQRYQGIMEIIAAVESLGTETT